MTKYEVRGLEIEKDMMFEKISDEEFDSAMCALDDELYCRMKENEIQESQSIKFARKFVTTLKKCIHQLVRHHFLQN